MKRFIAIGALAALIGACTPEQEAKWKATVDAIRTGVRVTTEAARQTLDEVCAQQPIIISGAQVSIGAIRARSQGPRTDQLVRDIEVSIAAFAAACSTGNASSSSLAVLAAKAWAAYQSVKAAQVAAASV